MLVNIKKTDIRRAAMCWVAVAFALLLSTSVTASNPAQSPPCGSDEYRKLDFWIGEWDTFEADAPDGKSIARAKIEPILQGCAIRELYEQEDGLVGDSILSYDALRKEWHQTWVTNRGSIMVLWGDVRDGELVLEGESHLQDGTSSRLRITWTVQGHDVRETALASKDNGITWTPAFDVVFRKRVAH